MDLLLVLSLPREAETVHVTRGVLDASLSVLGVTGPVRADITLALGEACANVIQHADPSDEYEVRVRLVDSRCVIEVVDKGRGFDAETLDDAAQKGTTTAEHGRGLRIIQTLADHIQVANRRHRGAIVRFDKHLQWEPGAPGLTGAETPVPHQVGDTTPP